MKYYKLLFYISYPKKKKKKFTYDLLKNKFLAPPLLPNKKRREKANSFPLSRFPSKAGLEVNP